MKTYEQFQEELRERKRERWVAILLSEEPCRVPGRRPRDPLKEKLLLELDRQRLRRRVEERMVQVARSRID